MNTQTGKLFILLFFSILFVTSCHTKSKQTVENNIQFESLQVDKTYHLLEQSNNPNCNLQLTFTFPKDFQDKEILKKLQKAFVSSYFGEKYEDLSPEEASNQYAKDYIEAYKELEQDFKEEQKKQGDSPIDSWYSYYEMASNEITFNQNNLISYTIYFENYTGGAHGSHSCTNHVINLQTGNPITEEDIFVENFQDDLAQILVNTIVKQREVEQAKDLENIGYFSIDEIFPNGNFFIDEKGITYTFNEYEIAAYVVGITQVFLPFNEISFLLKQDSPIATLFTNKHQE
ncbi:MAG: DUF3298 domain-containing protein [Parabacteroides sp.]|nr:DUF3298 domain-containing protein [Parabacteroides sp.]